MKKIITILWASILPLFAANAPINFNTSTGNVVNVTTAIPVNFPTGTLTINGTAPITGGVTSFNTRTGAVTLVAGDVNALSGLVINGVTLSGSGTLAVGSGGTLGTNAYTSTAYAPLSGATLVLASVNGVTLSASGSSTLFLNQAGGYSTPAGTYTLTTAAVNAVGPLTLNITGNVTGNVSGSAGSVALANITGAGTGVLAAGAQPVNAASGIVTANASGYAAPNILVPNNGFLTAGFNGRFEFGEERGYLVFSKDGYTFGNQIHGLENFVPPSWGTTLTDNGASPDVFTASSNHLLTTSNYVTLSGFTYGNTNTRFLVNTVPTSTSFTLKDANTGVVFNGNGTGSSGSFLAQTGMRDPHLQKFNGNYYIAYTVSNAQAYGNTYTSPGILSSSDTSNWTFVTGGIGNYGGNYGGSPCWIQDNGTTYVCENCAGTVVLIPSTSANMSTWGTPVALTLSGGSSPSGDRFLVKVGSTYCLYIQCASNTWGLFTSSTLTGTYTYQGAPSNWSTGAGVEGARIFLNNNGLYYAYLSDGSYYTSSNPASYTSWSAKLTVNPKFPLGQIDNGGGFCPTDDATGWDIANATMQWSLFTSNYPDFPPVYTTAANSGINFVGSSATGIGGVEVTTNSTTLTGIGSSFTHQLWPGAQLTIAGAYYFVKSVTSDTSAVMEFVSGTTLSTPTPFTIGIGTTWGVANPSLAANIAITGGGASGLEYLICQPRDLVFDNTANPGQNFSPDADSSYPFKLRNNYQNTYPIEVAVFAPTGALVLNQTGFSMAGTPTYPALTSNGVLTTTGGTGTVSVAANTSLLPRATQTSNTTGTITFNTSLNDEVIYNTSGTTIASATITLPSSSTPGEILKYATAAIITSITMAGGTVDIGTAPTSAAVGNVFVWQSDTSGHWMRMQ